MGDVVIFCAPCEAMYSTPTKEDQELLAGALRRIFEGHDGAPKDRIVDGIFRGGCGHGDEYDGF